MPNKFLLFGIFAFILNVSVADLSIDVHGDSFGTSHV